jgi:hypothetical protein
MSEPHYAFPQRTPVFTAAVVILCFAAFAWLGYKFYAPTRSDAIAPAAGEFAEDVRWRMTPQGRADRLAAMHQKENAEAATYGWVDKGAGVVRLPLDRAIELTVKEHAQK